MHDYTFKGDTVVINPIANNKKITATRFATILGLNPWATPFSAWCEITRTYEKPFIDNEYTLAGKAIEPILIQYLKDVYFLDIKAPTEVYGKDYFKRMRGDFYSDKMVFGGMWDAIGEDVIVEIKTTKQAENWVEDIPVYYKLQASLYAYLSGIDRVIMVCAFLDEGDYANPEAFNPAEHTIVREFSLSEEYPNFKQDYIEPALAWWENYVLTGVSPAYDEDKDKDVLKALRTTVITDSSKDELLAEIDKKQMELDKINATAEGLEKELKNLKDSLKKYMQGKFTDSDTRVEISSKHYTFTVSKLEKESVDNKALKADGLYDKYLTKKVEYRLTKSENKED